MATQHPNKAIAFITYNVAEKKFVVNQSAVQVLRDLGAPVALIFIGGTARQGKSFALGWILGVKCAFQVGHTTEYCTKGFWIWPKPERMTLPDGQTYYLVYVDSEGLDACDQEDSHSLGIFTLSTLLSSLFIYNSHQSISESSLDSIAVVSNLHRSIAKGVDRVGSSISIQDHPSLIWLLRDRFLGELGNDDQYLESHLEIKTNSEKNKIREAIKTLFPDRACFALPMPSCDKDVLTTLELLEDDDSRINRDFIKGLNELKSMVIGKAKPKTIHGKYVYGPQLSELVLAYVEIINEGGIPNIYSTWTVISEATCRKTMEICHQKYLRTVNWQAIDCEKILEEYHQNISKQAENYYLENVNGEEAMVEKYRNELNKMLSEEKKKVQDKIRGEQIKCQQIQIMNLQQQVEKKDEDIKNIQQLLGKQRQNRPMRILKTAAQLIAPLTGIPNFIDLVDDD